MRRLLRVLVLVVLAVPAMPASAAEPQEAMPVDQAFAQLAGYEYGQNDAPLHVIEAYVGRFATDPAHKAQVAERLAAVLAEPQASAAAKAFVCQQLLVVGTEAQVPLVAKMLEDPQTAEIARYTLEAIPGEASLAAIRGALERLKGMPLVGAVNSLGIRRDAQAVGPLAGLLGSPDPLVAAGAAEALGKIGSAEAAATLTKAEVTGKAQVALHNARLQCAERLAAAGDAQAAAAVYLHVWSSNQAAARRVAGLVGLVKVDKDKATPLVLETFASEDPLLQATSVRLARQLSGPQVTAALVARMEKLDATGQVLLLGVIAERGDRSAAEAVANRMADKDEMIRAAAIQAMGKLGDASILPQLARLAATMAGEVQQAARGSLVRLTGADIEPKLMALAGEGEPAVRVEILRALAARRSDSSLMLVKAAVDADPQVRLAAMDALAVVARAQDYGKLVQLLVAAPTPGDAEAAQRAVLAAGGRLGSPGERVGPVIAALAGAPAQAKPSLLQVISGFGGPEGLEAVRVHLASADAAIGDAAVRALAHWPEVSAAGDLLKIAQVSDNAAHRLLALRGYLRLAGQVSDEAARLKMLQQVRPIATTIAAKRMLLAGLAEAADPGALCVATEFLDDAEVHAEAAVATLKIARGLVRVEPAAVRGAMKKLTDTTKDKALADQAAALDEEAMRVPSPAAVQQALQFDKKRSDLQKAALAKRPPQGYHLACYLDCGPDVADGAKGGPLVRLVAGTPYFWPDCVRLADIRFGSVFFSGQQVIFEGAGLNPKKSYQIGFSWWDFDHDSRAQSLWLATGKGERETKILEKTKLPSGAGNQGPDGKTLPVPPEIYGDGALRISFRNESQPNVVVSELWLWESDADR